MDFDAIISISFSIELTYLIILYTVFYLPIKKKESQIKNSSRVNRIKKYLIKIVSKEIKVDLIVILILTGISFISLILYFGTDKTRLLGGIIFLFCGMIYLVISGNSISSYEKYRRKRENIYEAKDIEEILKDLDVKDNYIKKISKVIESAWNNSEKENYILAWILDCIYMGDKRVTKS